MSKEFDIVVAGGGIAGLSAGMTAARLGRNTLILTGDVPGGHLVSIEKVEGLPGHPDGIPGYDLCPIMQDQAAAAGAELMMSTVTHLSPAGAKWNVTSGEGDFAAGAVILATGTVFKKLDVPGEERLTGSGVSHCATCDAPLLRGRVVAVVGGGDSAMQEGLTLAEFASKVILLHRGDGLVGQKCYRDRVLANPKIEVRSNTVVSEILGETTVAGLRTQDPKSGAVTDVEVAAVFAYVGLRPNTALVQSLLSVDAAARIPTDVLSRTELRGLFAAGTIRAYSPCRAASASGDGAASAVAADRFLADRSWLGSEPSRENDTLRAVAHG